MPLVRLNVPFLAALLALTSVAPRAHAQSSATFDLSVYVPQPIAITVDRPLQFGKLMANTAKTVAYNSGTNANGQWTITGAACTDVDLRFTLPATLAGPGAAVLPIDTYTADWSGGYGAAQTFVPSASATRAQFTLAGAQCPTATGGWRDDQNGTVTVRIGGSIHAAVAQASGAYVGTIVLQVTYVGL